ncbi:MAG: AMMECR1 domain-containing protein [Spirochaetales bacterium]|nr:AMMECR1 domain-containing protein [Spirochaetales bacterium]
MKRKLLTTMFIIASLSSCNFSNKQVVYFHDRHRLALDKICEYSAEKYDIELIIIDENFDFQKKSEKHLHTSNNWLNKLILNDKIDKIIWIPTFNFKDLNNSDVGNYNKSFTNSAPFFQEKKIEIEDWIGFSKKKYNKKRIFSIDLNFFTKYENNEIQQINIQKDILNYIWKNNSPLITIAFSPEGQVNPSKSWKRFAEFYNFFAKKNTALLLEIDEGYESITEIDIEKKWNAQFANANESCGFGFGSRLWDNAPSSIAKMFYKNPPKAITANTEKIIKILTSGYEKSSELKKEFPQRRLRKLKKIAEESLFDAVNNQPNEPSFYYATDSHRGLGFRIRDKVKDRGCFGFYYGVNDMELAARMAAPIAGLFDKRYKPIKIEEWNSLTFEISIFGEFERIENPLDFTPGADALILEKGNERTLLQAAATFNRDLSKIAFLEVICRKAGLPPGSWKDASIKYYSAPSIFFIEKALPRTPNEKK